MSDARHNRDPIGVATLWRNRELLGQLARRQLSQEHKGTLAGKAWLVARPLLQLALYVFVFGYIFGGRFRDTGEESKATFALGIFLGLAIIHMISESMAAGARCIADNQRMVRKVKVDMEVAPAAVALAAAANFLIGIALALVGLSVFGHPPTLQALWLLPIFALLWVASLGLAYLFAALGVFARDVSQIVPVLSMTILFTSAVFYPVDKIPPGAWTVLQFNPILHAVHAARQAALWGEPPPLGGYAALFAGSCVFLYFLGYAVFQRSKRRFADHV